MRRLITIAACVLATAALPAVATAAAAVHFTESWTNEQSDTYMGEFACSSKAAQAAGPGLSSGSIKVTETANGGGHAVLDIEGSVDFYVATGDPESGIQLGAYIGTWTYSAHQAEAFTPGGQIKLTGVRTGPITFADGTSAILKQSFQLLIGPDGQKLFFAKASCGGQ
jgi:hypothetical protein